MQQDHEQRQVERAERREAARREQQRVARQERRHHEARLAEHDHEQQHVGPGAVGLDHLGQVLSRCRKKSTKNWTSSMCSPVDEVELLILSRPGAAAEPARRRSRGAVGANERARAGRVERAPHSRARAAAGRPVSRVGLPARGPGVRVTSATRSTGRVVEVEAASRSVTLAHEEIPGFMPAMTMPFVVLERDAALLQAMAPGDSLQGDAGRGGLALLARGAGDREAGGSAARGRRRLAPPREPQAGDPVPDVEARRPGRTKRSRLAVLPGPGARAHLRLHALSDARLLPVPDVRLRARAPRRSRRTRRSRARRRS